MMRLAEEARRLRLQAAVGLAHVEIIQTRIRDAAAGHLVSTNISTPWSCGVSWELAVKAWLEFEGFDVTVVPGGHLVVYWED